jgi:hypothetical protein
VTQQAVVAFHFPPNFAAAAREAMVVCFATQAGGIVITPFVAVNKDSRLFRTNPNYPGWRARCIREIDVSDLDQEEAKKYRAAVLLDLIQAVNLELLAVTGNVVIDHPGFGSMNLFWRSAAEKVERELQAACSLRVCENPAFDFLCALGDPYKEVYLKSVLLAHRAKLTEKTAQERADAYMEDIYRTEGRNCTTTFQW